MQGAEIVIGNQIQNRIASLIPIGRDALKILSHQGQFKPRQFPPGNVGARLDRILGYYYQPRPESADITKPSFKNQKLAIGKGGRADGQE